MPDSPDMEMNLKNTLTMACRFFFEKNNREPGIELPVQTVDLSAFNLDKPDRLASAWLGHSSLMINISGYRILTDPVFENKVSLVGPSRFSRRFPLDPDKLTHVDLVIISHDHYDHLNKASVRKLAPVTKQFVVPSGVGKRLIRWGIPETKITELYWWESYTHDSALTVTATPSQHFSGRGLTDRNTTLWASWVIRTEQFKVFFSGDSGYFKGFKTIGDKYGPFDMTFMECGAYDPMWHGVHMYPEETVQAHLDLKGGLLHPIHWGTFNLAFHSWDDPMKRLVKAAEINGVEIATPVAGKTIEYDSSDRGYLWWEGLAARQN